MDNMDEEIFRISVPIKLIRDEDGSFILYSTEETDKIFGTSIACCGETLEEAEGKFWLAVECTTKFNSDRSIELNRWKWFQKGPWTIGGKWFTIFGIQFYFRKKSSLINAPMVGGVFIPFTKWNIRINNHWIHKSY